MRLAHNLRFVALVVLPIASAGLAAQQVRTTVSRNGTGERVVRVETLLRQPPQTVWKAFATEEGLKCWAAPLVRLDLRTGSSLLTNYDKAAGIGGPGTISLGIVNYVEHEMMTFKVTLTDAFSQKLRSEDAQLQEVIQLQRLPNGGTRVVSAMVGWGTGEEWDKTVAFFARGNEWSYKNLAKCLASARP